MPESVTQATPPFVWYTIIILIVITIATGIIIIAIATRKLRPRRIFPLIDLPDIVRINAEIDDGLPRSYGKEEFLRVELQNIHNPLYSWASAIVDTPIGKIPVNYPVFRELEINTVYRPLLTQSIKLFLAEFNDDLRGAQIYSGEAIADDFLNFAKSALSQLGAEVILYSRRNEAPAPKPGQNIIVFDLMFNTGYITKHAIHRLPTQNRPNLLLFLMVNDLVPKEVREEVFDEIGHEVEIKHLYRLSEILTVWNRTEKEQKLSAALLTVRAALNNQLDWHADLTYIQSALAYVRLEALGYNKLDTPLSSSDLIIEDYFSHKS
ncbi:MAG: hypothetical protein ABI700_01890 [Chloroflexota bacterium]